VPKAIDWIAKTEEYCLTPEDLQTILRTAFSPGNTCSIQRRKDVGKLPAILTVVEKILCHADGLKDKSRTFRRAEAVLRIIAYALMVVSVVAGEATDNQVRKIAHILCILLISEG
jgi:hypothetical protein